MKLTVNGEVRELPQGLTIVDLLEQMGLKAPRVAVEVNRALVPRGQHSRHILAEGDLVEIVAFVGGG